MVGSLLGAVIVATAMTGSSWMIAGGTLAEACQFPTVATYRVGDTKCTAVLVHPEAVVTAAHCVADGLPSKMKFGEEFWFEAIEVEVTRCVAHDSFADTQSPTHDYAICRLATPVEGIPPTPLLVPCDATPPSAGLEVTIVGFGVTPTEPDFGSKRFAHTTTDSKLRSDGTIWIGEVGQAGCLGDSGGPAFVRGPDGGWRVLGVLTYGPDCGEGPMLYRALPDRIGWLEDASGLDLTPCVTANGVPASTGCPLVAADPLEPEADWASGCAGPVVTPAPTCISLPVPESDGDTTDTDSPSPDADAPEPASGCRIAPRSARDPRWGWLLVALVWFRRGRPR